MQTIKKQVKTPPITKEKVLGAVKSVAGFLAGNYMPAVKKANEAKVREMYAKKNKSSGGQGSPFKMTPSPSALKCWKGYKRKPGTKEFSKGSCIKK